MLCIFQLHEGDLQHQLLAGAQILLFSSGYLLLNCYMLWKALNPSCISEQIKNWKHRKQENIYVEGQICSLRGSWDAGGIFWHTIQWFCPLFLVVQFPYFQIRLQTGRVLYFTYVRKCLPAGLAPVATTGCLKYSKGLKAGGQALCSNYSTVLCMMRKPCRVQAWKYQRCRRWWVDGKKHKDKQWAERDYPETVALCSKASPRR